MKLRVLVSHKLLTMVLLASCLWLATATTAHANSGVLLYNPVNGAATYGSIDPYGQYTVYRQYPAGSLTPGWTHIFRASNGLLFFFRRTDALWATVQVDGLGNLRTLRYGWLQIPGYRTKYREYDLLNVVNTPNGILFCHQPLYSDPTSGGLIGQVRSDGSFVVTQTPGFSTWTNVVYTPNGVFFMRAEQGFTGFYYAVGRVQTNGTFAQTTSGYSNELSLNHKVVATGNDLVFLPRAHDFYLNILVGDELSGQYRVGGVGSTGQFALRTTECSPSLSGGNILPMVLGNDVLFYAVDNSYQNINFYPTSVASGWAAITTFRQPSTFINTTCWGKLRIKQQYPEGSFAAGWSKILYTSSGTFFHNPATGASLIGRFESNGSFTQLQNMPSLFEPGFTQVVSVTE